MRKLRITWHQTATAYDRLGHDSAEIYCRAFAACIRDEYSEVDVTITPSYREHDADYEFAGELDEGQPITGLAVDGRAEVSCAVPLDDWDQRELDCIRQALNRAQAWAWVRAERMAETWYD